ncbi:hypothetical protein FHX06_004129 [Rhizobium sp. BK512]|nr:hypothetical protein [Rhizobium sp. BK512]
MYRRRNTETNARLRTPEIRSLRGADRGDRIKDAKTEFRTNADPRTTL